jgi:hypothetical protein
MRICDHILNRERTQDIDPEEREAEQTWFSWNRVLERKREPTKHLTILRVFWVEIETAILIQRWAKEPKQILQALWI